MHAFHFGTARHRLFGLYHPPAPGKRALGAVLLCAPFGHEYIRTQRALRTLLARLTDAGMHVLKFDYFGCGDSAGTGEEATLTQWQADVAAAIDELKDMSGLPTVSLVGVRLGASLAAQATSSRRDVKTCVLWDPVLRGKVFLDEIRRVQAEWLKTRPRANDQPAPADSELIGFPMSPDLIKELNGLDLLAQTKWTARRTITIATAGVDVDQLSAHLTGLGVASEFERTPCDCQWLRPASVHLQLLANDVIVRVAALLDGSKVAA